MRKSLVVFILALSALAAATGAQAFTFDGFWRQINPDSVNVIDDFGSDIFTMYAYDLDEGTAGTTEQVAVGSFGAGLDSFSVDIEDVLDLGPDGLFGFYFDFGNTGTNFIDVYEVQPTASGNRFEILVEGVTLAVVDAQPVPLPGAIWLLVGGAMGVLGVRRR